MRGNSRTRSRNNRRVKSAKSLRGGMRSKRTSNSRKTRSLRKTRTSRKNRKSRKSRRRRRNMKGGNSLEFAPLPCDANGNTDWNSPQQVGPISCASSGFDGAELDARAAGLGIGEDYLSGLGTREGSGPSSSLDANTIGRQDARAANNIVASPDLNASQQEAVNNYRAAESAYAAHMDADQSHPTWSAMANQLEAAVESTGRLAVSAMFPPSSA